MNEQFGKIKWFSEALGHGIVKSKTGKQFYFNIKDAPSSIKKGRKVKFKTTDSMINFQETEMPIARAIREIYFTKLELIGVIALFVAILVFGFQGMQIFLHTFVK